MPRESIPRQPPCRQWLVIFSFGLNSAFNAFLCMNFSVVAPLTQRVLRISESEVAWLYTGMLLTVFAGMPIGLLLVVWWEGAGLCLGVMMNTLCAVVRFVGVRRQQYVVVLVSALFNGVGAWTILPMPAKLSQERFPFEYRTLTTSLAVQANYAGWMLGSFLVPLVVHDRRTLEIFLTYQAAFSALVVTAHVAFYRPVRTWELYGRSSRRVAASSGRPSPVDRERAANNPATQDLLDVRNSNYHSSGYDEGRCRSDDLTEFMKVLCTYPSFGMQIVAYGVLAGVGFAVPGCSVTILKHLGFAPETTAWVNIAFIGAGVLSGLLLGLKCNDPLHYGWVLKTLFLLCMASIAGLAVTVWLCHDQAATPALLLVVLGLSLVAGTTSLGFIGIGIEAAALYPANSTYVCFSVELFVQLLGGVLNQLSSRKDGFMTIAVATWFAGLLLLFGYRRYESRSPRGNTRDDVPRVTENASAILGQ